MEILNRGMSIVYFIHMEYAGEMELPRKFLPKGLNDSWQDFVDNYFRPIKDFEESLQRFWDKHGTDNRCEEDREVQKEDFVKYGVMPGGLIGMESRD